MVMSQKTLFTKSALAVAVALISTRARVGRLSVKRIFLPLARAGLIQGKAQLPMMQVTLAVTRIDYHV